MTESLMFKPLDKKRYFEQIAQLIRERILRENLKKGYKLPTEQKLAGELNVSRSVVREALRILDVMGYINIKKGPQGGIFVSNLYHNPSPIRSGSWQRIAILLWITFLMSAYKSSL